MNDRLSHIDEQGRVRMVDVSHKPAQRREAVAEAILVAAPATLDAIMQGNLPKGEALAAARIAGIQAAKKCDELIPLCHTLPLDAVRVEFELISAHAGSDQREDPDQSRDGAQRTLTPALSLGERGKDSSRAVESRPSEARLRITTTATTTAKTGVEMEALVAASIAALTIYDMAKAIDKQMRIEHVVLLSKKKSD